jgi:hypothetical protein
MSPTELSTESTGRAESPHAETARFRSTPSVWEVTILVVGTFVLFVSAVQMASHYGTVVDNFGDSSTYMTLASAIRRWDFHGITIKQFWGLPYAMAAVSKVTGMSDRQALLGCSFLPSLLATLLAWRLGGGWIAGYFSIMNFDWVQRSCLGGSEPLFVCLLFGSFLSVRRQRWLLAALLASFATVVRPLEVFGLVGIGLTLLWQGNFRKLAGSMAIGTVVAGLYTIPLARHFGDPLATVSSYHSSQWQRMAFRIPFLRDRQGDGPLSSSMDKSGIEFRLDFSGSGRGSHNADVEQVPPLLSRTPRGDYFLGALSMVFVYV